VGLLLGRREPAPAELHGLAAAPLTYPEVGATAGAPPPGYTTGSYRAVVGGGRVSFRAAAEAVLTWQMHRDAGLGVTATSARAERGAVVVLRLGVGRVGLAIPCRVVDVVAERDRAGFAYGTLPGHPEVGEERFVVELGADDLVRVRITVFSRPAWPWLRPLSPLLALIQQVALRRYARAVRRAVRRAAAR
jgi:uncharacterized protein (UPF0548 family)